MTLTFTRTLSDAELACLRHDLPGDDGIRDWINGLIDGKISNCETRMAGEALSAVRAGALPLKELPDLALRTLAVTLSAQPDYKDREAREAEMAPGAQRPSVELAPPAPAAI
jgi:hypothetical protein